MRIILPYGTNQSFKYRTRDINIIGRVEDATFPIKKSIFKINGGQENYFYIEEIPDPGLDWTYQYKNSPAVLRLKDLGDFNVEFPITAPELRTGFNTVEILIEDSSALRENVMVHFTWDSTPLPPMLDLSDLSNYTHIQQVAQVVNGAFDLDPQMNLIRSRAPVYPDALCVIGSPYGSQEAFYSVRFTDLTNVKWLGPSDFFAGHEGPEPPIGIKPGWSTVGMACMNPRWEARAFLSFGDHAGSHLDWVVQTAPPKRFIARKNVPYVVRHQIYFEENINTVRYKIWEKGTQEPREWLCEESNAIIPANLPRYTKGSFSLFQHSGMPIEWSEIRIRTL